MMPEPADFEVRIAEDPAMTAALAAATIGRWLNDAIAARGLASLGFAGGSTPVATYEALRDEPVDWERVIGWMSDERWVPLDHDDSNSGMIYDVFLDHVDADFIEIDLEADDPEDAAADYEDALAGALIGDDGRLRPDVTVLGVGGDGHTASLFPDTDGLEERERAYVANWIPEKEAWRLTATLPLLWSSRRLAFIVVGDKKADVVASIINGSSGLPAEAAATGAPSVTWFLDRAAARRL